MNEIFMMGYDVWSDGLNEEEYLLSCHKSKKYKSGQFKVLVTEESDLINIKMNKGSANQISKVGELLASLILYKMERVGFGIGSIAVPNKLRGLGYGSKILKTAVDELMAINKDCIIFLYSDISKVFYEKLGFTELSSEYQKYKNTVCMYKTNIRNNKTFSLDFEPPKYF